MTAVEYLINELSDIIGPIEATLSGELLLAGAIKRAKAMEKEHKIEFACKVAEVSAEKYIQGKTTEQIAEELIKQQR